FQLLILNYDSQYSDYVKILNQKSFTLSNFYIFSSSWRAGDSPPLLRLALDSSSSFPCPAFLAIAKSHHALEAQQPPFTHDDAGDVMLSVISDRRCISKTEEPRMKGSQETKRVNGTESLTGAHARDSYRLTDLEPGTAMVKTELSYSQSVLGSRKGRKPTSERKSITRQSKPVDYRRVTGTQLNADAVFVSDIATST
ncbi:hypothetical protein STEG23_016248, partial [Scotinomys teguina]